MGKLKYDVLLCSVMGFALSSCNGGGVNTQQQFNSLKNNQKNMQLQNGLGSVSPLTGLTPGVGFVSDSNSIAPSACFQPSQVVVGGGIGIVDTHTGVSAE